MINGPCDRKGEKGKQHDEEMGNTAERLKVDLLTGVDIRGYVGFELDM